MCKLGFLYSLIYFNIENTTDLVPFRSTYFGTCIWRLHKKPCMPCTTKWTGLHDSGVGACNSKTSLHDSGVGACNSKTSLHDSVILPVFQFPWVISSFTDFKGYKYIKIRNCRVEQTFFLSNLFINDFLNSISWICAYCSSCLILAYLGFITFQK